jgi:predicted nucleic-acid-binding protein
MSDDIRVVADTNLLVRYLTADDPIKATILNTPGIDVQDEAIISAATKLYGLTRIDFVDAWIIEFAKAKGVTKIHTFDTKHFKNTGIDVSPP